MREMMNNITLASKVDIEAYCSNHKIVIVWSLDIEKVMYMSKVLNLKFWDKDAKLTFLKDVTQRKIVWFDHRNPQIAKLGGICHQSYTLSHLNCFTKWDPSLLSFIILCKSYHKRCVSFRRCLDENAYTFLSMHLVLSWFCKVSWCKCLDACHLCRLYILKVFLVVFKNSNFLPQQPSTTHAVSKKIPLVSCSDIYLHVGG